MKKIVDIPNDKKYIGYIWMSDSDCPLEFHNPTVLNRELSIDENDNPFIIEGQLYCKEEGGFEKSYSIKYTDGAYIVTEYDLNEFHRDKASIKFFIPNRIKASKLKFEQYWKSEPDELCEGMEVFNPGPLVFVGFEYK
ncbi:MAG: TIGR04423 family type III CRISPR-associated protein [Dysgonamonadaceae bacterium]|jgi:CRISPR type III-associated protein (TIGR04423 family)|nr:TIGR04423 family type III CRISPR-associated protein [Dysgonamonadaceae bacterium]